MSWTDDRVEILTKMWAEGNSASQIAKELGGVTRNAVIGKVHRLGLSNRATTTTSNKSESKTKLSQAAHAPKPVHSNAIGKLIILHLTVLTGCINFICKNIDNAKIATIAIISQKLGLMANSTSITMFQQPGKP